MSLSTMESRSMDLILWRHAEAHEHPDLLTGVPGDARDLARRLTPRGEKQATRMAAWLDRQLPDGARVFSSPASRCEQTALALGASSSCVKSCCPKAIRWPCWNWCNGRTASRQWSLWGTSPRWAG
jgi:phosphohistidine phosphatase